MDKTLKLDAKSSAGVHLVLFAILVFKIDMNSMKMASKKLSKSSNSNIERKENMNSGRFLYDCCF
jgi:hypothetical protein